MKKIFGVGSFVILFLSLYLVFVDIGGIITMYTGKIKGVSIAFLGCLLYLYSIFFKKKKTSYGAFIISLIGYIYTFYSLYSIYNEQIELKLGFYLYCLSLVFLVFSIFSNFSNDEKAERASKLEIEKTNSEVNKSNYVFGRYIYGIYKRPDLCNHSCVLTILENSNVLELLVATEQTHKYEIKKESIEKITIKNDITMKKEKPENDEYEIKMLATVLGGVRGNILAEIFNSQNIQDNIKYVPIYTVTLYYKENEESKKILIEFSNDPTLFFEQFGSIFQKI